jgi:hypothetical protein
MQVQLFKPSSKIYFNSLKQNIFMASKKWYERYHWFLSSNGLLVFAGKNMRNNRTIMKRYCKPEDLILSSEMENAPLVVVKTQNISPIPAETIYEAAEFVIDYSDVWKKKIENFPVFYVKPEQVFANEKIEIRGEKKFLEKIKPRLSIGIKQEKVWNAKLIFGPPTAVKKQTPYMLTLIPGDVEAEKLSGEIKKLLLQKIPPEIQQPTEAIELKEIMKIVPHGKADLVR